MRDQAEKPRTGGCLCGSVQFVAAKTGALGICHCRMCQRWAGGPFIAVTVEASDMAIVGADYVGTYESSSWATRSHCTKCGSVLWYRFDPKRDGGGSYEVPIGLLNDQAGLELQREIYIDRKPAAFAFDGAHQRLTAAETEALYRGVNNAPL